MSIKKALTVGSNPYLRFGHRECIVKGEQLIVELGSICGPINRKGIPNGRMAAVVGRIKAEQGNVRRRLEGRLFG